MRPHVSVDDAAGGDRYAFRRTSRPPRPGFVIHDDWDALDCGPRAAIRSAWAGIVMPAAAVTRGFPAGDPVALHGDLPHGGAVPCGRLTGDRRLFAHARAIETLGATASRRALRHPRRGERRGPPGRLPRRALGRGGSLIDAHYAAHPAASGPDDEIVALFAEVQAIKAFVNDAGVRVVDPGAGLLGRGGLSRRHVPSAVPIATRAPGRSCIRWAPTALTSSCPTWPSATS